MTTTYSVDDIFEEIPGDSENVLMNIPEEIRAEMGWKPGDTLTIKVENEGLIIRKNE
jgi:AbrB family looped-hinge helix DNA binding protein